MNNYRIVRCVESGRAFTEGEQYAVIVGGADKSLHIMWQDEDGDLCELPLETQKTNGCEIIVPAEGERSPKFINEDEQPAINKEAEWIEVNTNLGVSLGKCSNCVKKFNKGKKPLDITPLSWHTITPYCPICGSRMKGTKE